MHGASSGHGSSAPRSWHRLGVLLAGAVIGVGISLTATPAPATATQAPQTRAHPAAVPGSTTHYAVDRPACAQPKDPSAERCFALERVDVAKGTAGATRYVRPATIGLGPHQGYTPDDLATAYGYDPTIKRPGQLVAIVDWFDDPNAQPDLNAFDTQYGLPKETATSFRKVNEQGKATPLPKADQQSSVEIALDIESVRAVCHTCRILLVESTTSADSDLATAENTAVRLGASEVSNSFGESERKVSPAVLAGYHHPGVVITVSTGDDGWFGWDFANDSNGVSNDAAVFPADDPDVIAVGGTELAIDGTGKRAGEIVWNQNGLDDATGSLDGAEGAGGGGCSTLYAAPPWQAHNPGYPAAHCQGKRLDADVSAIADPSMGFDIFDSYAPTHPGWITIGGTSLSAPITAALFALAGGSGGAAYPASSLYVNASHFPTSVYDVTGGGNGFCDGDTTASCGAAVNQNINPTTHNPNALDHGNLDCSFPRDNTDPATAPAQSTECNAATGYDGPSGLGTPNSLRLFTPTAPAVTLARPSPVKFKASAPFGARAVESLSDAKVTNYLWTWGDGHSTSTAKPATTHEYTKGGTYSVTLTVTDNLNQTVVKTTRFTVGKPAAVHLSGPSSLKAHKSGSFSARGTTTPNTGAEISKVSWVWGDGTRSTGTAAKHSYQRAGKHTITVTITDNSGVSTTVHKTIKVS